MEYTCMISLIVWKENFTHPITIKRKTNLVMKIKNAYLMLAFLYIPHWKCLTHVYGIFRNLKEKEDGYVTFGDGSHSQVIGKGMIEILGLPLLTDVLYIKWLKVNLLSITQICE